MSAPAAPDTIFAWVRRIPPGFVTTYGDLIPGAPRQAGRLLSQGPPGIPWWRVVRADGTLAKGSDQQQRLAAEGVPMRGARVNMRAARLPHAALIDLLGADDSGGLSRADGDAGAEAATDRGPE